MSIRTPFVLGILLATTTGAASAQDRLDLKLGLGPTISTYSNMSAGAHVFGAAEFYPLEVLGLRVDGFAGAAGYAYRGWLPGEDPEVIEPRHIDLGLQPLYSANMAVVLREPPGDYRLYALLGVGYNYFEQWSQYHPREHDYGFIYGVGLLTELGGHSWFVELSGRVFGNVMSYKPTDTKSFAPLTFGMRF